MEQYVYKKNNQQQKIRTENIKAYKNVISTSQKRLLKIALDF